MTSFIEKMREESEMSLDKKSTKARLSAIDKEKIMEEKKDALMIKLTDLYHNKLMKSISRAASNGTRTKYINFVYDDFKANVHGMGKPSEIQSMWLSEMSNPDSKYLKKDDGDDLECLEGLRWNIWGNAKFTTVFEW